MKGEEEQRQERERRCGDRNKEDFILYLFFPSTDSHFTFCHFSSAEVDVRTNQKRQKSASPHHNPPREGDSSRFIR